MFKCNQILFFVCFVLISTNLYSQEIKVFGKVKDSNGTRIAGANIIVKGTPTATITNYQGDFEIVLMKRTTTLAIFFINYKHVEQLIKPEDGSGFRLSVTLVLDTRKNRKLESRCLIETRNDPNEPLQ